MNFSYEDESVFHGERLPFQEMVLEQLDICMQKTEFQSMLPLTCKSYLHMDNKSQCKTFLHRS